MYIYFIIFPHFLFEACYGNVKTFGDSNNFFSFFFSKDEKNTFTLLQTKNKFSFYTFHKKIMGGSIISERSCDTEVMAAENVALPWQE